jgi:NitT/TauT family transport system ATP-binding protein
VIEMATYAPSHEGDLVAPEQERVARIAVSNLTHHFGDVRALDDVSLSVREGELVSLVGASGCGKTTLLNLIAGLETRQRGELTISGAAPVAGHPDVAYLFARDSLLPWRTVLGNVELGMELRQVAHRPRRQRALDYIAKVGLAGFESSYPAQLSHGMRQRVALARTIAQQPKIILLDEPFSALDAQTKVLLQKAFLELWAEIKATVVLVTHDLGEAIVLSDRVFLLSSRPGRLKATFDVPLDHPRDPVGLQADERFHRLYERMWSQLQEEFKS